MSLFYFLLHINLLYMTESPLYGTQKTAILTPIIIMMTMITYYYPWDYGMKMGTPMI